MSKRYTYLIEEVNGKLFILDSCDDVEHSANENKCVVLENWKKKHKANNLEGKFMILYNMPKQKGCFVNRLDAVISLSPYYYLYAPSIHYNNHNVFNPITGRMYHEFFK